MLPKDRTRQRWSAFLRAAGRRWLADVKRVLTVDPGVALPRDEAELAAAQTLARSGGELKGGMAKLAQLMAYHQGPGAATDAAARHTLSELWEGAPGAEPESIRRVIIADLGKAPEELFSSWEATPFAAASLGEVHAATAHDGTRCAVKVQYPGVADALRADLESRMVLRRLVGGELGGGLDAAAILALRDGILGELDYLAEGRCMKSFRVAFAAEPRIVVPRLFAELSSPRVLTMERLDGQSLASIAQGGSAAERAEVALTLFRFAWGAPLRHGLVNADPNPGNYVVLDAAAGRVGFLDFGCVITVDEELLALERRLWRAILKRDGETLRHSVAREGLLGQAITLDSDAFRRWERLLAAPFLDDAPFAWTAEHARELAHQTTELVLGGGMKLPASALLLWRQRLGVTSVIAGLGATANFRRALLEVMKGV